MTDDERRRRAIAMQLQARARARAGNPPPTDKTAQQTAERGSFSQAATAMINDVNAGFQRVNPVSVGKSAPVGRLRRGPDGQPMSIDMSDTGYMDGPIPQVFDASKFVTMVDPKTGNEMIYRRTPEMDESGAASAGRVLSLGLPNALAGATAKAPLMVERITPSLGASGPVGGSIAGAADASVVTRGPVLRDASRFYGQMQETAGQIADTVGGGVTQADAAGALRDGATKFVNAFEARAAELYKHVPIAKTAPVAADETRATLENFVQAFADKPNIARELGVTRFQSWLEDMGNGLTWEQARQLRSDIGSALGKLTGPLADQDGGRLKQLYGSLSRDLSAAAVAAGPEAAAALARADRFYRAGRERIDGALSFLFKDGAADGQTVGAFIDMMKVGGRSENISRLLTIKKSMPQPEWREVVGTVIRRLGEPSASSSLEWSAAQFWTRWNGLSPQARRALFGGEKMPPRLYEELDALASLANRAKQAEAMVNRSRSGAALADLGVAVSAGMDPVTTLIGAAVARAGVEVLTMPPVLRALRRVAQSGSLDGLQAIARGTNTEALAARAIMQPDATNSGGSLAAPTTQTLPPTSTRTAPALPAP